MFKILDYFGIKDHYWRLCTLRKGGYLLILVGLLWLFILRIVNYLRKVWIYLRLLANFNWYISSQCLVITVYDAILGLITLSWTYWRPWNLTGLLVIRLLVGLHFRLSIWEILSARHWNNNLLAWCLSYKLVLRLHYFSLLLRLHYRLCTHHLVSLLKNLLSELICRWLVETLLNCMCTFWLVGWVMHQ